MTAFTIKEFYYATTKMTFRCVTVFVNDVHERYELVVIHNDEATATTFPPTLDGAIAMGDLFRNLVTPLL